MASLTGNRGRLGVVLVIVLAMTVNTKPMIRKLQVQLLLRGRKPFFVFYRWFVMTNLTGGFIAFGPYILTVLVKMMTFRAIVTQIVKVTLVRKLYKGHGVF